MQDSYTIPISDQQTKTAVPLLLFCVGVPEFVFAVGVGVDVAALLLLFCCCCSVVAVLLLLVCSEMMPAKLPVHFPIGHFGR
jgi:hypothetical protein